MNRAPSSSPTPPAVSPSGVPSRRAGDSTHGIAIIGRRLAVVSSVFLLAVGILMATNSYLLRTADPLKSPVLKALTEQLQREPGNAELREHVRELDWMARRAFFVKQWQLDTGVVLLVIGGIVFIVGLHLAAADRHRLPLVLRKGTVRDEPWKTTCQARRALAIVGTALLLVVWVVHFLTQRPPVAGPTAPATTSAPSTATATNAVASFSCAWPRLPAHGAWPSFRGPQGLGIAAQSDPPTFWDGATGSNVLWKTEVPLEGYNSPVVWEDRVFLTGADANKREVYCFHADTGERLWTADASDVPGTPATPPEVTEDTGYAAPSVAADGRRVVALFGTGDLIGLDVDGRRLWARNLGAPDNHYGHSSSLLLLGDAVIVQYDHAAGSALLAIEAETGRDLWQAPRQAETSWASPILAEADGQIQIVLSAAPMVAAYEPASGRQRWSTEVLSGEIGSSPAYAAGRIFAANQYAKAVALDAGTGAILWSHDDLELPDAGSPVATEKYLFMPTSHGPFSCLAAADGRVVWQHEFDMGGYGSPVLAGDRLYWVTADGRTRIIKASDTFELIAEPALGEASVCTPAAVGRRLYLRGARHLFCLEAKASNEP